MNSVNLLVIAFLIKLLSRNHLFKYIREKSGEEALRQCRVFEKTSIRHEKVAFDLRFLLTCKKEKLVPTFARPKISVPVSQKTRVDIAKLIIETELKNKHRIKHELRKQVQDQNVKLRESTSFLAYHAIKHIVHKNVNFKKNKWAITHEKKLNNIRTAKLGKKSDNLSVFAPNVIHNFSSYVLSPSEIKVLAYSLEHYVPYKHNDKKLQVEFERFFQTLVPHTTHFTEEENIALKTKFLSTWQNYSKIKTSSSDQKIIDNLAKNRDLVIIKQDKGRGVVLLNRSDYLSKVLAFLDGTQFKKLECDPTKTFQAKVQRTLLGMKNALGKELYKKLYPSSSQPGLFFGLAKVHKLKGENKNMSDLPLRPVISNIGTATYRISKYLSGVLLPLTRSEHCIASTREFIGNLKNKSIDSGYTMVSFDVVSLFTSIPLDFTINLILDKIYKDKILKTKLSRANFKLLLEICTKEMHFSFNECIYKQVNGVAMGSPLGPVLANIFMVELENTLIPQLSDKLSLWYRYVDDTFTFIRKGEIKKVENILNSFHEDINFTYEEERNKTISFLDVGVTRKNCGTFETRVHRKETDTNVYLNWNAFAPNSWKIGTLKGLFRRAYLVCSTKAGLQNEIKHLKFVFTKINGYPSRVVHKTLNEVIKKMERENALVENTNDVSQQSPTNDVIAEVEVSPYFCIPYKGKQGEILLNNFKVFVNKMIKPEVKPRFIYQGKKLGSFFHVKDKVRQEHRSNLIYGYSSSGDTRKNIDYVGETRVRFGDRVHEHIVSDKQSSVFKYNKSRNVEGNKDDFVILETGYGKAVNRKIAESLYIKQYKPALNEQVYSYKLKLFN